MKKQLELNLYKGTHGGRRPGSGRKRIHSAGVSHRERPQINHYLPLHVNFKYKLYIRNDHFKNILFKSYMNSSLKDLYVIYYSIESNHVHLIIETLTNSSLTTGMKSLLNTITRFIGKGTIQIERYHLHILRSPTEVSNAVNYVINNHEKHTGKNDQTFSGMFYEPTTWLLKNCNSARSHKSRPVKCAHHSGA